MMKIDYEQEVRNVYPDAICHENDLLKCWFVKSMDLAHVYYGQSEYGRNEAWHDAYKSLKREGKI